MKSEEMTGKSKDKKKKEMKGKDEKEVWKNR